MILPTEISRLFDCVTQIHGISLRPHNWVSACQRYSPDGAVAYEGSNATLVVKRVDEVMHEGEWTQATGGTAGWANVRLFPLHLVFSFFRYLLRFSFLCASLNWPTVSFSAHVNTYPIVCVVSHRRPIRMTFFDGIFWVSSYGPSSWKK